MPLPPIIDAHHHFYDLSRFRYPFLDDPDFGALTRSYGPADFRADIADLPVIGSVHVQGGIDHASDPVAETAWLADIVKGEETVGVPSVAVAYADLRHAGLAGLLARHAAYPFIRGIRQEAWFDPASTRADIPRDDLLKDPAWRSGYRRLADFGLSFDLLAWPWQLSEAARFVAAVPEVPVMVEHTGCPVDRSPDGRRDPSAGELGGVAGRDVARGVPRPHRPLRGQRPPQGLRIDPEQPGDAKSGVNNSTTTADTLCWRDAAMRLRKSNSSRGSLTCALLSAVPRRH